MCPNVSVLSAGEDYQHIEFGVDEVMSSEPVVVKVSSTLNPQAPEFILGCQPAQKSLPTSSSVSGVSHGPDFNSVDGGDSEASALDGQQVCSDVDGVSSGLGQRERKKKKKRPPGYYNYLEGCESGGAAVDGVTGTGLVNGHGLGASALGSEDTGTDLTPSTLSSTSPPGQPGPPTNQRTCDSPDESSVDLASGAASLLDGNAVASSSSSSSSSFSSSSHSRVNAEGARTAEQHSEPLTLESPELQGSNGNAPCPTSSPSPPPSAAVLTTDSATTDEDESQTNGTPEQPPATRLDMADTQAGAVSLPSPTDLGVHAPSLSVLSPVTVPVPKSWASLFHNSKPLPGGPQAYVEVKASAITAPATPAASAAEQPEKPCDIQEGPVPVSEDPMAPKLAGIVFTAYQGVGGGGKVRPVDVLTDAQSFRISGIKNCHIFNDSFKHLAFVSGLIAIQ